MKTRVILSLVIVLLIALMAIPASAGNGDWKSTLISGVTQLDEKINQLEDRVGALEGKVIELEERIEVLEGEDNNMGWLTGYAHRQKVPLKRTGGAVSDYQMKLTVHKGGLLAAEKGEVSPSGLGNQQHNVTALIDKALWTFNGNQYITFINNDGHVIVGKRSLPSGDWSLSDTGRTTSTTDPHEIVSLGIDSDGYIHISWGMHVVALEYARSDNAEDVTAFTNQPMTGSDENAVTYPRFFKANSTLYFSYRNGDATIGSQYLNEYDTIEKTWSVLHHKFIDGGSYALYSDNFAVDAANNIHVSFMWRTSNDPITLSDYSYAYSDNGGTTWRKSDGSIYEMPITQANAEKFESGAIAGLINHNSIDVDGNGHPHIAYWKEAPNGHVNYYHTWHSGISWQTTKLTNYDDTPTGVVTYCEKDFARPGILINRSTDKAYIFGRHGEDGYIEVHYASSPYTSWVKENLGNDRWGWQEFGGVDYSEWHNSHNFYLMAERTTTGNPASVYILKSNLTDYSNSISNDCYLYHHVLSWTGTVPNDIRFTKADGVSLLDYWIESSDANDAVVWIEFDSIGTTDTYFYIYYGKSGDTTTSNDDNTFLSFWNAEEAAELDDWPAVSGKVQIERSTTQKRHGSYAFRNAEVNQISEHGIPETSNRRVVFRCYDPGGDAQFQGGIFGVDQTTNIFVGLYWSGGSGSATNYAYRVGATWYDSGVARSTAWHKVELLFKTGNVTGLIDGTQIFSVAEPDTVYNLIMGTTWVTPLTTYYDDIFIANFVSPEPTWGAWGSEESLGAGGGSMAAKLIGARLL